MTDKNFTSVNVLLDRSGSMSDIWTDMIGGLNAFIEEQRKLPGRCDMHIAAFDDHYETVYSGDIKDAAVPPHIRPRNLTALYDSLHRLIQERGAEYAAMSESERPGTVIVLVITDGMENRSKEMTLGALKSEVERQEKQFSWKFIYQGTGGLEVMKQGQNLGLRSVVGYNKTGGGVRAAQNYASAYVGSARLGAMGDSQMQAVSRSLEDAQHVEDVDVLNKIREFKDAAKRSK
jgi:hypothetical protein